MASIGCKIRLTSNLHPPRRTSVAATTMVVTTIIRWTVAFAALLLLSDSRTNVVVVVVAQSTTCSSICADGTEMIGSPTADTTFLEEPVSGDNISCTEMQNRAEQGYYDRIHCQFVQFAAAGPCCVAVQEEEAVGTAVPAPLPPPSSPAPTPSTNSDNAIVIGTPSNPRCEICPDLPSVTTFLPDDIMVQDPIIGDQTSCFEVQNRGFQGLYSPLQCQIVKVSSAACCRQQQESTGTSAPPETAPPVTTGEPVITDPPGTDAPAVTKAPTTAPSYAPSASPSHTPSISPSAQPSAKPSSLPPSTAPSVAASAPPSAGPSNVPSAVPTSATTAATSARSSDTDRPTASSSSTQLPSLPAATTIGPVSTVAPTTEFPDAAVLNKTAAAPENATDSPTTANTSTNTQDPARPTPAPTQALPSVQGSVNIELRSVAGSMPDSTAEAYESQTTAFLQDELRGTIPPIRILETTLISQSFASIRRLRKLQTSNSDLRPLTTTVRVAGRQQPPDSASFSNLIAQTINENPNLYISYLRNSTPPINQVFFKTVESVEAASISEPAPPTEPTLAPASTADDQAGADGSEGLTSGAIAGIVIGSIAGAALIGAGGYYVYKYRQIGRESTQAEAAATPSGSAREGAAKSQSLNPQHTRTDVRQTQTQITEEAATTAVSESKQFHTRTVTAPAGKLGIVVDTAIEGPVVHTVKSASPLEGLLFPGDIIISIGEEDTRGMSAGGITNLMVKTANTSRKLTVMNTDPTLGQRMGDSLSSNLETLQPELTDGTRTIVAPPGKLGIVVDSAPDGPTIFKVKDSSPLTGVIFEGDVLLAIDGIDTTAMSAAEISSLMAKKGKNKRKLLVR